MYAQNICILIILREISQKVKDRYVLDGFTYLCIICNQKSICWQNTAKTEKKLLVATENKEEEVRDKEKKVLEKRKDE